MLARNSDRYLEYMPAVWCGGVLNPISIRAQEIVYSLDDCDTGILIVEDHVLPLAPAVVEAAQRRPLLVYVGEHDTPAGMLSDEQLIASAAPVPDAFRRDDDLASIMYTGRSAGKSKGVMRPHLKHAGQGVRRVAGIGFYHAYGLIEASPVVSVNRPENHLGAARASERLVLLGGPCRHGRRGEDRGRVWREVPHNTVDEIVVRGANVMQGYWRGTRHEQ